MAGSYSSDSSVTRDEQSRFSDKTFKWIGIAVSGFVALVVVAFLGLVVSKIDVGLIGKVLPRFFNAYLLVLFIVVVAGVLSISCGVLVGLGRVSKTRFTNTIASGYVQFFRGTPLLFQLAVVYFGIPALWPGGTFPITNWGVPTAILTLTLNHAAYVGEAIRGGIGAVPDGQSEAARSLGMSYVQSMREVVLPQAWRNALAAIGNDQIILVKDTSLLTFIAVGELINVFRDIYSNTFKPWTPLVIVAVAYLTITLTMNFIVRRLEARSSWGERQ